MKVLSQLFGKLFETASGGAFSGGNDPIISAIMTFNGAVLIVGGILAGYTILLGVIGTAHDGEMLGKQLSSAFVPIRYTAGVALVLPVIGGYSIIQLLVAFLVMNGVGLADNVWISYAQQPVASANTTMLLSNKEKVVTMAENLYKIEYCMLMEKKAINNKWWKGDLDVEKVTWQEPVTTDILGKKTVSYMAGIDTIRFDGRCGTFLPIVQQDSSGSIDNPGTENQGLLGDLSGVMGTPINLTPVAGYHNVAAQGALRAAMKDLAVRSQGDIGKLDKNALYAEIIAASQTYISTVQGQAKSLVTTGTESGKIGDFSAAAEKDGWFIAGAWFIKQVYASDAINNAMNTLPNVSYQGDAAIVWAYDTGAGDANNANVIITSAENNQGGTKTIFSGSEEERKKAASDSYGKGWGARLATWLGGVVTGIDIGELKNDQRHPIVVMADMGSRLLGVTLASMVTLTGVTMGLSIWPSTAGVALATTLQMFLMPLIATLWVVAFLTTNLIPMMPFIIWLGAIIGWTILVVEAIIAAPLWAIMHLHPTGSDIVGRGGAGYALVLGLLLRPVLLIFGFIAAVTLSAVFGEFINKLFFQVWSSSRNGDIGFVSTIFAAVMYVSIMLIFITKMFSVTTMIADQLLKWMGGPSEQLGQFASAFEQRGNQTMAAAAAFTNQAAAGGMRGAAAGLGKMADARQKKKEDGARAAANQEDKANDMKLAANKEMDAKSESADLMNKHDGGQAAGNMADLDDNIRDLGGNESEKAQDFVGAYNKERNDNPEMSHSQATQSAFDNVMGSGAYAKVQAAKNAARSSGGNITKAAKNAVAEIQKASGVSGTDVGKETGSNEGMGD
ncbi:DotA/TraY family protein [Castellaniella sp.]|uniref:DotA/TraY family protein n=1 Tax=Castellaniella sp. TaxID=1955812 RepID=UPI003A939713